MIVTVGGIKGGSGKTAAAVNLAVMLQRAGRPALLVDADDQASASEFADQRAALGHPPLACVRLSGRAVLDQVRLVGANYPHVVIDTGGRDTASQRAALIASELVLLPFQPGNFDLWTLRRVEDLLGEVRTVNPALRALAYISRGLAQGSDNADAQAVLAASTALELAPVVLGNRKAVNSAAGEGLGVVELAGRAADAKAAAEMTSLFWAVFAGTLPAGD